MRSCGRTGTGSVSVQNAPFTGGALAPGCRVDADPFQVVRQPGEPGQFQYKFAWLLARRQSDCLFPGSRKANIEQPSLLLQGLRLR
jgi:hypothetical protein